MTSLTKSIHAQTINKLGLQKAYAGKDKQISALDIYYDGDAGQVTLKSDQHEATIQLSDYLHHSIQALNGHSSHQLPFGEADIAIGIVDRLMQSELTSPILQYALEQDTLSRLQEMLSLDAPSAIKAVNNLKSMSTQMESQALQLLFQTSAVNPFEVGVHIDDIEGFKIPGLSIEIQPTGEQDGSSSSYQLQFQVGKNSVSIPAPELLERLPIDELSHMELEFVSTRMVDAVVQSRPEIHAFLQQEIAEQSMQSAVNVELKVDANLEARRTGRLYEEDLPLLSVKDQDAFDCLSTESLVSLTRVFSEDERDQLGLGGLNFLLQVADDRYAKGILTAYTKDRVEISASILIDRQQEKAIILEN